MSLTGQIARTTAIQFGGKLIGMLATVATVALMTRTLGAAGYGAYVTAFAWLQVAFILVDFGLQMTAVTLIADPRRDARRMLSNLMGLRLSSAIAMAVLAAGGVWLSGYPLAVKQSVAILAAVFVCADIIAVLTGLFQQRLTMARAAAAEIAGKLAMLAGVAAIAAAGGGLLPMVAATAAAALLHAALLWTWARRILPFTLRFEWTVWRDIFTATWPLALTIALNLIYFKMDTVILSWYRNAAEVGWYGAPYRILELCINLGYLFLGLVLPLLTKAAAANDRTRFAALLQRSFDVMVASTVPLVVGGALLAEPLMALIAGPSFAASGPILAVLLVATSSILLAAVFGYGIVALGQQRRMIPFYAGNAACALAAYLIFIPRFGALAAAWLTVASETAILAANLVVTRRLTGFFPRLSGWEKTVAATILMAAVLLLTSGWPVLARTAVGGLLYLGAFFALSGIPSGILRQLMKREP